MKCMVLNFNENTSDDYYIVKDNRNFDINIYDNTTSDTFNNIYISNCFYNGR